jgi:endonuclease-3
MKESQPALRVRAGKINQLLKKAFPEADCPLEHTDPVQLLVATILSAQCTDARVNMVTPALFARYPDAQAFATARQPELEKLIHSTGFFRNKARNIIACCKGLVDKHGGRVPNTIEELTALPGIGRKTANVVLGHAHGVAGIVVDTHVGRLSRRLALTVHTDPNKIERDLMQLIPERDWSSFSMRLIYHGRKTCTARKPNCEQCPLSDVCPKVGVEQATHGNLPRKRSAARR